MLVNNVGRYYLITFLTNLAFTLPIWVIFGTDYLGLTHLQSYWLGTFYWLVSAVFEIPTGSWADRFGRKRIYSLGIGIGIATMILFILTKNFYILMISQLVAGFAVALKSGPLSSLIYDWLKIEKREDEFLTINSNNHTYLFFGRVIGGAIGGLAYTLFPTLPYMLLIIANILVLFIVHGLTESRHITEEPLSDKEVITASMSTFIKLLKKRDFALVMLGTTIFTCLGNILWFAYQPFFQKLGFGGNTIGLLYIPVSIASAFGTQIIKKIIPKLHTSWLYTLMLITTGLVAIAMNSLNIWIGMIAIVCLSIIFGFDTPATSAFFQHHYPSKIRATMSSIESLFGSLVLVTASVSTGFFIDNYSLNTLFIFVMSTALSMAALMGYANIRLSRSRV